MKHVFIVTFGRTGSTALLKVLNTIDGACIRGQNGGVLQNLVEASTTLRWLHSAKDDPSTNDTGNPWYGIRGADPAGFAKSLADTFVRDVLAPPPGTRITGFKEIRYTDELMPDSNFGAVIRFMLDNFETPRIIFLTRDPVDASQSGAWQERDQDIVIDVLQMTIERFQRAHATFPNRTFLLDHSAFDRNPSGLRPLFDWLDEEISDAALNDALHDRLLHLN